MLGKKLKEELNYCPLLKQSKIIITIITMVMIIIKILTKQVLYVDINQIDNGYPEEYSTENLCVGTYKNSLLSF